MCVPILSPKEPEPPKVEPVPEQPKPVDTAVRDRREEERRRARYAAGRKSTLLTSPLGLNKAASKSKKTLLGE
jgi:hypothetical protein